MFYKILVQPAKSNKSTCKNCKAQIEVNTLRIKVVDATKFNQIIKKYGRQNLSGQGLSRGYFQCMGPNGQNVSIEKYFVHLNCYVPIEPHPFQKPYFDIKTLKKQHITIFQNWLSERNKEINQRKVNKKGSNKKNEKEKKERNTKRKVIKKPIKRDKKQKSKSKSKSK